tara:strand:- start:12369 stop:12881 length:513 start_codon:yes stop_codon:yes gene_type:complete
MIKLLDIENNTVIPTVHCKTIKWLRVIEEKFPDNYLKIYGYVFYMACPSQENPYFNLPVELREETVIVDLEIDFSLEEDEIIEALKKAVTMYETPTVRAYNGITIMLDNLTEYMTTTAVTAGRDGNINSLLRIAKEFDSIRQSYKGIAKDLEAEQQAHVRGGQQLGYDQV